MLKKYLTKNDNQKYEVIMWQLNNEMNLRSNLSSCVRTRHGGCNITDMIKNSDIELAVGEYIYI